MTPRLPLLDALRGAALLAMIGYHLVWDLAYVGLLPPGSATTPLGRGIAAAIAASFLALAGTSFALAHAEGVRWRPWAVRLVRITLAALAVTAVTFWATPDTPIRFGILHMIALAAVLSLPFLAAPVGVPVLAAGIVLAVDGLATGPAPPAAIWLGLGGPAPPASDFRPVFPWLAPVLLGLAAGPGLIRAGGMPDRLATVPLTDRTGRCLRGLGRHSLAVYLIHQPVLLGLLWAGMAVATRGSGS